MKPGDKIRVSQYMFDTEIGYRDYVIEEFRHCLGFFRDENHRKAGEFTPLCDLFEPGPDSKSDYISNYGEYITNMVQGWSDLASDQKLPERPIIPRYYDQNEKELKDGDVIDIQQTVNGQNLFYIKCVSPLDIRYNYDRNRKYEYDKGELIEQFPFSGEPEFIIQEKEKNHND